MGAPRRCSVVALACLSSLWLSNICLSSLATAQQSDQVVAERVLGKQWKQISRRAGMIFAGTVLAAAAQTGTTQTGTIQTTATDRVPPGTTPALQLTFRVDQAIAGVEPGQILTIHEWAGAWSRQRPMYKGQHVLIFLYPLSRLGLTSPVGGSIGQVVLDPSGENVSQHEQRPLGPGVSVVQLERAIRSARNRSAGNRSTGNEE